MISPFCRERLLVQLFVTVKERLQRFLMLMNLSILLPYEKLIFRCYIRGHVLTKFPLVLYLLIVFVVNWWDGLSSAQPTNFRSQVIVVFMLPLFSLCPQISPYLFVATQLSRLIL